MADKEYPHDEDGTDRPGGQLDTDLDALDAFLDEFGKADDGSPGPGGLPGDDISDIGPFAGNLFDDLDEDDIPELKDDVVFIDPSIPLPEPVMTPETESADSVEPALSAFAMRGNWQDSPQTERDGTSATAEKEKDNEEISMFSKFQVPALGLAGLASVLAIVAIWLVTSMNGQLRALHEIVSAQQKTPVNTLALPDRQTQEALARLEQQVSGLARAQEDLRQHLDEPAEGAGDIVPLRMTELAQGLDRLQEELDKLGKRVDGLAAKPAAAAPAASKPAARLATPAAPKAAQAAAAGKGSWMVIIASLSDLESAEKERQRMQKAGFSVEVQTTLISGRTWYRVCATGFKTREEARAYGDTLRDRMRVKPWVSAVDG